MVTCDCNDYDNCAECHERWQQEMAARDIELHDRGALLKRVREVWNRVADMAESERYFPRRW